MIQYDQDQGERRTSGFTLLCGTEGILGCHGAASRPLSRSEAEDTRVVWNGRVREDADGGLFRSGVPLAVSLSRSFLPSLIYSRYKHTFFVDASSLSSIQSDLQAAIRALGEGNEQKTFEDMITFLMKGAHEGKWLLIFDNADDPKVNLRPYFPECFHGTILITTRNPELGRLNTTVHLQLGPMGPDEAYETLIRSAHQHLPLSAKEDGSAKQLIEELGLSSCGGSSGQLLLQYDACRKPQCRILWV